jgi:hypothetical protein
VKIYVAAVEALRKKERQDEIPSLSIKELGVTTYYLILTSKICLLASPKLKMQGTILELAFKVTLSLDPPYF